MENQENTENKIKKLSISSLCKKVLSFAIAATIIGGPTGCTINKMHTDEVNKNTMISATDENDNELAVIAFYDLADNRISPTPKFGYLNKKDDGNYEFYDAIDEEVLNLNTEEYNNKVLCYMPFERFIETTDQYSVTAYKKLGKINKYNLKKIQILNEVAATEEIEPYSYWFEACTYIGIPETDIILGKIK